MSRIGVRKTLHGHGRRVVLILDKRSRNLGLTGRLNETGCLMLLSLRHTNEDGEPFGDGTFLRTPSDDLMTSGTPHSPSMYLLLVQGLNT